MKTNNIRRILISAALLFAFLATHALIDITCYGPAHPTFVAAFCSIQAALFVVLVVHGLVYYRVIQIYFFVKRSPYFIATSAVTFYIIACFASGAVGAVKGYRAVTGLQYIRIIGAYNIMISLLGLRPEKATYLVLIALVPLAFQPLALLFPTSWESQHLTDFLQALSIEATFCTLNGVICIAGSYALLSARGASWAVRCEVAGKAARSQALLETAVPPDVAHLLLTGVSPSVATRSCDHASVAFVRLSASSVIPSTDLLKWYGAVYAAFDTLVEAYTDRVVKIESVTNVYVVVAGLGQWGPTIDARRNNDDHSLALASFCVDLLELCAKDVPNAGRVHLSIGLSSGPLIAGIIGKTRCQYRIFGSVVNDAVHLLDTGLVDHVHCSVGAARSIKAACGVDSADSLRVHGLALEHRGGASGAEDDTYWLQPARALTSRIENPSAAEPQGSTLSMSGTEANIETTGVTVPSLAPPTSSSGRRVLLPPIENPPGAADASVDRLWAFTPKSQDNNEPLPSHVDRPGSTLRFDQSSRVLGQRRTIRSRLLSNASLSDVGAIPQVAAHLPGAAVESDAVEYMANIYAARACGLIPKLADTLADTDHHHDVAVGANSLPVAPSEFQPEIGDAVLVAHNTRLAPARSQSSGYSHRICTNSSKRIHSAVVVPASSPVSLSERFTRSTHHVEATLMLPHNEGVGIPPVPGDEASLGPQIVPALMAFGSRARSVVGVARSSTISHASWTERFWSLLGIGNLRFADKSAEFGVRTLLARNNVFSAGLWLRVISGGYIFVAIVLWLLSSYLRAVVFMAAVGIVNALFGIITWFVSRAIPIDPHLLIRPPPSSASILRITSWILMAVYVFDYVALVIYFIETTDQWAARSLGPQLMLLWNVLWLSMFVTSISTTRCTFVQAIVVAAVTLVVDVCFIVVDAYNGIDSITAAIAFASLVVFRVIFVASAYVAERNERSDTAIRLALVAADDEAKGLLCTLFPPLVVESLQRGEEVPTSVCRGVTVMHIDMSSISRTIAGMPPSRAMSILDAVYSAFDKRVSSIPELWRVETAGAAYVVVGGIPELFAPRRRSSAQRLPRTPVETTTRSNLERSFNLSLSILDELEALSESSGIPLRVQIGVHCGEVVTGVVGSKVPRFCVLGPAIVEAEQAALAGSPNHVSCTSAAHQAYLASSFHFAPPAHHTTGVKRRGGLGGVAEGRIFEVSSAVTSRQPAVSDHQTIRYL